MPKYDIKKTARLKFVRFGGLSSINQLGYETNTPDFHAPPAKRGFYAFVWPYVELFLLGKKCTCDPRVIGAKFTYVRDNKGVIITDLHPEYKSYYSKHEKYWSVITEEYNDFYKKHKDMKDDDYDALWKNLNLPKYFLTQRPKPRIFEYNGLLWHHLGNHLKPHLILATKGDWVKTDMNSYRIALDKEMHAAQTNIAQTYGKYGPQGIVGKTASLRRQCRDHLEVFFERI